MKTPSFSYMGGKAKLRKWLVEKFPTSGDTYFEPFAGLGNVFWHAKKVLTFQKWELGDRCVAFFQALRTADLSMLPEKVGREDFEKWKVSISPIAKLIESRVSFAGKGYSKGFIGEANGNTRYSRKCYEPLLSEARRLSSDVVLVEGSWEDVDWERFTPNDFVYLDPPYYGTVASYPNIDHEKLALMLSKSRFRWALSGYENEVYKKHLVYLARYQKERDAKIKTSLKGKEQVVVETLWTNY